jgi:hypothetical protein
MKLQNAYGKSGCEQCYFDTLAYRIKKYLNFNETEKKVYEEKYCNTLKLIPKEVIESYKFRSLEELHQKLQQRKKHVEQVEKTNKNIINHYKYIIENLFINYIPNDIDELFKITYLAQYLLSNITYSEDMFKYCISSLPGDGFDFDFKNGIPADKTIVGMLVIGQGGSDEISNLACYLGAKLDLNIEKVFTNYQGYLHALNIITLKDGRKSYIDFTNIIRNNKLIYDYFLLSGKDLNKNYDYKIEYGYNGFFRTSRGEPISGTQTISSDIADKYYGMILPYANELNQEIDEQKATIYKSNGNAMILKR